MTRTHGAGMTHPGKVRDHNEDFILVRNDLGLYIVADGMGGHAAGEVASETAARTIEAAIEGKEALFEAVRHHKEPLDAAAEAVELAILEACREVFRIASAETGKAGMGTTVTMLKMVGYKAILGHVGDSRLYLHRGTRIEQVSQDHSMVAEMLRMGIIDDDQAASSYYRHVLTRAVGTAEHVQVDTLAMDVFPGDRFLLCSDGLADYVPTPRALHDAIDGSASNAVSALVQFALEAGGEDNVSIVLVDAVAESEDDLPTLAFEEFRRRFGALDNLGIFQELAISSRQRILNACVVEPVDDAAVVLDEGEEGDSLYCVLQGSLTVHVGEHEIGVVAPGDAVGETMLLTPRPSPARLTAGPDTRLLVLSRRGLDKVIRKRPRLGVELLDRLSRRAVVAFDRAHAELRKADVGHDRVWKRPGDLF